MNAKIQKDYSALAPKYKCIKFLGRGSFGEVVSAIDKLNNIEVAIKKIILAHTYTKSMEHIINEIQILDFLDHENTLTLLDIIRFSENPKSPEILFIVTEKMETNLSRILKDPKYSLTTKQMKSIAFQIIRGLHYLHSSNIFHRDLSSSNILLDLNCNVKIADFGYAIAIYDKNVVNIEYTTTRIQTLSYRAPEILENKTKYSKAIDLWSVGCILAEMARGKKLFQGNGPFDLLQKIKNFFDIPQSKNEVKEEPKKEKTNSETSEFINKSNFANLFPSKDELLIDLISKLLEYDPEKRWTTDQCFSHPYFSDYANTPAVKLPENLPQYEFSWSNIKINVSLFQSLLDKMHSKYHTDEELIHRPQTKKIENEEEKGKDILNCKKK